MTTRSEYQQHATRDHNIDDSRRQELTLKTLKLKAFNSHKSTRKMLAPRPSCWRPRPQNSTTRPKLMISDYPSNFINAKAERLHNSVKALKDEGINPYSLHEYTRPVFI